MCGATAHEALVVGAGHTGPARFEPTSAAAFRETLDALWGHLGEIPVEAITAAQIEVGPHLIPHGLQCMANVYSLDHANSRPGQQQRHNAGQQQRHNDLRREFRRSWIVLEPPGIFK